MRISSSICASNDYLWFPADAPTRLAVAILGAASGLRVVGSKSEAGVILTHLTGEYDALRLQELAAVGEVASVAQFHYSFMGAPWPPTRFEAKAREIADLLKRDAVDGVVLCPV